MHALALTSSPQRDGRDHVVTGTATAWVLVRYPFPGKTW